MLSLFLFLVGMQAQFPPWLEKIIKKEEINVEDHFLQSKQVAKVTEPWSFSQEWEVFEQQKMNKTWSWTTEERLEQFLLETGNTHKTIQNLTVLDAGCGNGLLSKAIAKLGANVLAVDMHQNLSCTAKKLCQDAASNLYFLQADINDLPIRPNSFDLIISNGVLHHTPNTRYAFLELAKRTVQHGQLYVWLYRRPYSLKNKILLLLSDLARSIISRLSPLVQKTVIKTIARFFHLLSKVRKGRNSTKDYNDILIDIYDSLTPKYRHYHHPIEVAGWFHEAGFDNPVLSHWDNSYGFGMFAVKRGYQITPPGENFGKKQPDPNLHLM